MKTGFARGFTLVEILMVVLIGIATSLIAVPVYRNMQDKNRYLAAEGVLRDLGSAMTALTENHPDYLFGPVQVTGNGVDVDVAALDSAPSAPTTNANAVIGWLRGNNYIKSLPLSSGVYKEYAFWIKTDPGENFSDEDCCSLRNESDDVAETVAMGNVLACMTGNNSNSEYLCAWVDKLGNVRHNSVRLHN